MKIDTFGFDTTLAPYVYPDVNRVHALIGEQQSVDRPGCRCVAPQDAVRLGLELRTSLAVANRNPGDPRVFAAEGICTAQPGATCAATRMATHDVARPSARWAWVFDERRGARPAARGVRV